MAKSNKKYSIGVDVGGTKITAVLIQGGKVLADSTLGTPQDTLDHFLIMVQAVIEPLLERAKKEKAKISTIGVGIPGMIGIKGDKILKCPNLPILNGVNLPALFKRKFGLSVVMDNDAACFVRAEAQLGAGKNYKNIYGLTIGTGIGGGWWLNNNVHKCSFGGGSEPGHMILNYHNDLDWEKTYHNITDRNPKNIAKRAFMGDQRAERIFEEVGQVFGAGFANIVNIIGPEIIIIGGGVSESSDLFLSEAKKTMEKFIINPAGKKTKIAKAKLGQLAGAIGASLLAK